MNHEGEARLHVVANKVDEYAYKKEDFSVFKFLIESGLDPMVVDKERRTETVSYIFFLIFIYISYPKYLQIGNNIIIMCKCLIN